MMINRYETLSDTVPHEEYILCICESGDYAGHSISDIMDDVRSNVRGDKLTIQDLYPSIPELEDTDRMKQNSVWVIFINDCLAPETGNSLFKQDYLRLQMQLEMRGYPAEAGVFLCTEGLSSSRRSKVEDKFPSLTIADTKDILVGILSGHFNESNPISQRGQDKILRWNNEVCNDLGVS